MSTVTTNTGQEIEDQSDFKVDARGSACPGPLLETKKAMRKVKVGQILEVWSADQGSRKDIGKWATFAKHDYHGYYEDEGFDRHFITRKK